MDKDLPDELLRITGERKKSKTVNAACREFVRFKQLNDLLQLKEKLLSGSFQGVEDD